MSRISWPPMSVGGFERGVCIGWRIPTAGLLCRHLPLPPPPCYLCAPMIAHGETLGLLHLRMSRSDQSAVGSSDPRFRWT